MLPFKKKKKLRKDLLEIEGLHNLSPEQLDNTLIRLDAPAKVRSQLIQRFEELRIAKICNEPIEGRVLRASLKTH